LLIALALKTRASEPVPYEVARAAGLLAFSLLALQVVLAGRFKLLDRAFGLDAVTRFHRSMGILTSLLLLAHPALLLLSTHGHVPWDWKVALGAGALLILAIGVLATLFFRVLRLASLLDGAPGHVVRGFPVAKRRCAPVGPAPLPRRIWRPSESSPDHSSPGRTSISAARHR
jgi:hypothetical protein